MQGKAALVTGGARRAGAAIARRLHQAGANVLVHYRGSEADALALAKELNAARAGSAATVKADLLAPVAARALLGAALSAFGRLDLLVNNASAFYPTRVGAIVNIVDIHAERPLKGYPVYSIAKAGLAAMTRSLALELAPRVRVNGVAPGAIAWPEDGQFDPAERDRVIATTPLGRTGTPEDIAQAVHFLACAPYVTGQILAVDGGRSIFI